jgi:hypothetical protein
MENTLPVFCENKRNGNGNGKGHGNHPDTICGVWRVGETGVEQIWPWNLKKMGWRMLAGI